MRDRPDLYVILGVEPSATLAEIQSAYRQRVQVVHPDRFDRTRAPEAWAHANTMLRELNGAYRTLSDPRLRREYDLLNASSLSSSPEPAVGSQPPRRTNQPTAPKKQTGSRVTLFAGLAASISALFVWGALQDRAEQRDADALFLSPASGSRQGSTNTEATVKKYGGRIAPSTEVAGSAVEQPPSPSSGSNRGLSIVRVSPGSDEPRSPIVPLTDSIETVPEAAASRDDSSLRGCEPGTTAHGLPENGSLWRYDRLAPLAPLEVKVQGSDHYLVKLEREGVTAAMMFVRAASSAEIMLPLGNYVLKYSAGSGEYWCGELARFPFGRQTSFHKADELFSFRKESDQYSGYTVELFLQTDGNLSTSAISPNEVDPFV